MVLDGLKSESLTHFQPMLRIYTPWKHQKTSGFVFRGYRSGTLVENGLIFSPCEDSFTTLEELHWMWKLVNCRKRKQIITKSIIFEEKYFVKSSFYGNQISKFSQLHRQNFQYRSQRFSQSRSNPTRRQKKKLKTWNTWYLHLKTILTSSIIRYNIQKWGD